MWHSVNDIATPHSSSDKRSTAEASQNRDSAGLGEGLKLGESAGDEEGNVVGAENVGVVDGAKVLQLPHENSHRV
jgi:hypothetical protein